MKLKKIRRGLTDFCKQQFPGFEDIRLTKRALSYICDLFDTLLEKLLGTTLVIPSRTPSLCELEQRLQDLFPSSILNAFFQSQTEQESEEVFFNYVSQTTFVKNSIKIEFLARILEHVFRDISELSILAFLASENCDYDEIELDYFYIVNAIRDDVDLQSVFRIDYDARDVTFIDFRDAKSLCSSRLMKIEKLISDFNVELKKILNQ